MLKIFKYFLTINCLFFLMNSAFAVKLASFYQADLPVKSQSDEERQAATKTGLIQILTKLTGDSLIANGPSFSHGLQNAENYVEEFSYSSVGETANSPPAFILHIRYSKEGISQLLKKSNVAYWGENRPLILVWLSISEPDQSPVIAGEESSYRDVLSIIKGHAKRYGMPMIFPVMDMTDLVQVTPSVINGMDEAILKEAGKRYSPDGFLVGRIIKTDETHLQSQWQLVVAHQKWTWIYQRLTMDETWLALFKEMNQALAKHYTLKTHHVAETWLKLQIANVSAGEDLQAITEHLKQMTMVKQVELSQISGESVELAVLIRGSTSAFQENTAIDQHFILKSVDEKNQKWLYEWVR